MRSNIEAQALLKNGESFSRFVDAAGESFVVSFWGIRNFLDQQVAYLVSYQRDETGNIYKQNARLQVTVIAFFLLLVFSYIYYILSASRRLEKRVQKEVAIRHEQEQFLIQQSRHAAMGEMIGNIAHQWRQPLNALGLILQKMEWAQKRGNLSPETVEQSTVKGYRLIQQMSRTIQDFQNFFKPDKERELFDQGTKIAETLSLIETTFNHRKIDVTNTVPSAVYVNGYPGEFAQVLLNLFQNAKDVFEERSIPEPTLRISSYQMGKEITIGVQDNGGGISPKVIEKIFDPYFTTKEEGRGTGIGLYMSRTIIEQNMDGKIWVKNQHGGACFFIRLPLPENPAT